MAGFETVEQLMLTYLLEEAIDDLRLSDQRVKILSADGDEESARHEQEFNLMYKNKVVLLERAVKMSEGIRSSAPSIVEFGLQRTTHRNQLISKEI